MDVKSAFLNRELDEEIFMTLPEGVVYKGDQEAVCRLQWSIYGLKQASRQWYKELKKQLISDGFEQTSADPTLFI